MWAQGSEWQGCRGGSGLYLRFEVRDPQAGVGGLWCKSTIYRRSSVQDSEVIEGPVKKLCITNRSSSSWGEVADSKW
jgi:hypothetical protein